MNNAGNVESVRVNISYRPLRICWAISDGDIEGFRLAVRQSLALFGGRFNPIVIVDDEDAARTIVKSFRADIVMPVGDEKKVKNFTESFDQLKSPFFGEKKIFKSGHQGAYSSVLDIQNAILAAKEKPEWRAVKEQGVRFYNWDPKDVLSDVFLMHLGAYPSDTENSIDYTSIVRELVGALDSVIDEHDSLPPDIFDYPSIVYLSRHEISRHYSLAPFVDFKGFYLGDSSNLSDLVECWNLRAADNALFFVDVNNLNRYRKVIPKWREIIEGMFTGPSENAGGKVSVLQSMRTTVSTCDWDNFRSYFGGDAYTPQRISSCIWKAQDFFPPRMYFKEVSSLGSLMGNSSTAEVSLALSEKPFVANPWFNTQHFVASISFGHSFNESYTLSPPYIPEINDFYGRAMYSASNMFRVEPNRIGIVISNSQADISIKALSIADLFKKLFEVGGFIAKLSSGGLITRQLINQLGGLHGATVFKIPGVRRLLRTHGPTAAFTKRSAIQLIGEKDPDNPTVSFKEYKNLYIEPRALSEALTPAAVFSYLVEKGIFRLGSQLSCPHCQMTSWTALDNLRQRMSCDMCGRDFDATRQLVDSEWYYRRSGVLGAERNAQGAIPVVLALQQLRANMYSFNDQHLHSASLDLMPVNNNKKLPVCEIDFVWFAPRSYPEKPIIVLAECKDQGRSSADGDGATINEKDIQNLAAVANSFPPNLFEVIILLVKLCPFTASEIGLARSLNEGVQSRVILLTNDELETSLMYDRASERFDVAESAHNIDDLLNGTNAIFFDANPRLNKRKRY